MKNTSKIMIIYILGIIIILDSADKINLSFSSTEDNNVIGQDGKSNNEVSQSEKNSQNTEQNNMCVSGDSTSFSCNNMSSENIGDTILGEGPPGEQGPQGPPGEQGPEGTVDVYRVDGPTVTNEQGDSQVSSTANCAPGDSVTGGGVDTNLINGDIKQLTSEPNNSLNAWTAVVTSSSGIAGDTTITAFAVCQDNTP